jgi:hypothetical protein
MINVFNKETSSIVAFVIMDTTSILGLLLYVFQR